MLLSYSASEPTPIENKASSRLFEPYVLDADQNPRLLAKYLGSASAPTESSNSFSRITKDAGKFSVAFLTEIRSITSRTASLLVSRKSSNPFN
jgi:hypothetical protein